jgi:hypothetical protein
MEWDKGTEVPTLSLDKGTTRHAQILPQDGPEQPVKIPDRTEDRTITIFLSKSGMGRRTGRGMGQDNHYFFSYDFL